jgi:hypothetical protein
MKLDHLVLKKEFILLVLLGTSAVCAVFILTKIKSFFATSAKAEALVRKATALNGSNEEQIEQAVAKSCAVADDLKKANLFSPPAPKRHPVTSVSGILGDEALIGGKWYKAGDRVQDARIVAVEATQVRVEWQGREKIFTPLQATDQPDPGGSRRTSRSIRPTARAGTPARRPPQLVKIGRSSSAGGDGITIEKMEKSRQKAEKQRLAIEKKELQRASKQDAKKSQPNKKKKNPDQAKKAREKATEKKAKKLSRK